MNIHRNHSFIAMSCNDEKHNSYFDFDKTRVILEGAFLRSMTMDTVRPDEYSFDMNVNKCDFHYSSLL